MIRFSDRKSFALILTLSIMALLSLFYMTLLAISQNDLTLAYRECNYLRSYYLADAGLADGYKRLRDLGDVPSAFHFVKDDYPVGEGTDTGSYEVWVSITTPGPWPVCAIRSTGTYRGASKTMQLTMQLTSFSHWAYMTDTEICYYPGWEGVASYWVTGNIVNGPLQVNDKLYVAGNPIFNGPVSVVDTKVTYYDPPGVDNPQFNGGLWLGVAKVPLPDPTPLLNAISDAAQEAGGLLLDSTDNSDPGHPVPGLHSTNNCSVIEFLANGTMNVTNIARGWNNHNIPVPANGAIYVTGGEVDVKGVLNGQVTVGCDQNIYTADNIIYHDTSPGNPNPASTDVLGLVAKNNVIFPNDLPDGDKEIDAYIVALNGSFYLENMAAVPNVKGKLVQYGGVMAKWSATVFGCFDAPGNLLFGYLQIPYYDARLQSLIPPCFTTMQDQLGVKYRRILYEEL